MQLVLDCAQMDQSSTPDFVALYAAGFRVAIFRRSQCYYDTAHGAFRLAHDPVFARDSQAARDAGLVVGAYLFPSFVLGAPTPAEQVANFYAAGGTLTDGDLCPFLDVEFPGKGVPDTHRTPSQIALLVGEFVDELKKQGGRTPGIYSSHVQLHDTGNGLGGACAGMVELAECLLWNKIPYRLGPGHALDQVAPTGPHEGRAAADPNDYYRVPMPWEGKSGWFLRQWQGDARGLPGNLHQADVGDVRVSKVGDVGSHVLWIRRRLAGANPALDVTSSTFDDDLASAVCALQRSKSLDVDGVVGPRTLVALSTL